MKKGCERSSQFLVATVISTGARKKLDAKIKKDCRRVTPNCKLNVGGMCGGAQRGGA